MNAEMIKTQFNAVSEKYDRQRLELIPCFHDFYHVPLEISATRPTPGKILDIGAGTGLMSAFFFEKYPGAEFSLVDISGEMLNKAKQRFEGIPNFTYYEKDFAKLDFLGEKFDLVISGLAIHHLEKDQKKKLFREIYSVLHPGGVFINADQVAGENEVTEKIYTENWKEKVIRNRKLSDAEKEATFERIKLDKLDTLSCQLSWLAETGFINCANYFQYFNFVVFAAFK